MGREDGIGEIGGEGKGGGLIICSSLVFCGLGICVFFFFFFVRERERESCFHYFSMIW